MVVDLFGLELVGEDFFLIHGGGRGRDRRGRREHRWAGLAQGIHKEKRRDKNEVYIILGVECCSLCCRRAKLGRDPDDDKQSEVHSVGLVKSDESRLSSGASAQQNGREKSGQVDKQGPKQALDPFLSLFPVNSKHTDEP